MTVPGISRVLVVGAGIGGLSTAIALGRRGIVVDLVERSANHDVYGVGIILQSNAIRALDQLGLAERCVAQGFGYSVSSHCDHEGNPLRDRPKPNVGSPRFPSSCGILRRTLHTILRDAAIEAGATIRLNTTVKNFKQSADAVDVVLSDETHARYDLMVGADGVYSKLRSHLFGDRHQPRFTGQGCWRITAARPSKVDRAIFYHGSQSLAGLIPVSDALMYLLLLTPEPGNPRFCGHQVRANLAQRLRGYGGIVGSLAADLPQPEDIIYRPLEPILLPLPWAQGRIVLIGDAAHATTPHLAQGASMAFEDAVVLDQLLADPDLSVSEALLRFGTRRFERCRLIVQSSAQIGEWQMASWSGAPVVGADPIGLSAQVLTELGAPI